MICLINPNLRVRSDESNFTLESARVVGEGKNAGQTVWSTVGYYGTLDTLFHSLINRYTHLLLPEDTISIQQLQEQLEDVLNLTTSAVQRCFKMMAEERAATPVQQEIAS